MKKRFISVLLCLCFVCALLPIVDAHTNNHTSAEAVAWANSQIGIGLEYDGVHPYQCVDLIKYYYDYLGNASFASGNAIDYASNSLPDGWVRVYGDYQPGDIAVWYANHSCSTCSTGPYGHVGIITAVGSYQFDAVNQNFNSQAYCTKNTFNISALLCAIRPDFSGGVIATMDWTEEICNPTETSAYISIKAVPNVSGSFGECGITIKDANTGAVVGRKTETADPTAKTYLILYYYVTEELGVVLTPGKSYTYQFYTYFNGTRYDSPVGSFTTPHTHSYLIATTPPTCTEQGYTTHTCSICGDSYVDTYVPALGHDLVTNAAVAPTCTATGLTAGEHCTRCDYKVAQETVPALEHANAKLRKETPATCTQVGYTAGKYCPDCKSWISGHEVIPALDHNLVIDAAVAATCTETGLTEGSHCTRCDYAVKQEVVPALGHNIVTDKAVAATCTETGLTEGSHCTRCDYAVKQETVPALGHDLVTDAAVAPTCTATGLTAGEHCTRCDYKVAQETVPALGHNWDAGVVTVQPTETEKGEKTFTCARCGETKTETIPELSHVHSYTDIVTPPTCTEKGYTTHTCACGDSYVDTYVGALGHIWDAGIITEQPTETKDGVKTFTCSRCGATRTETIPATGEDKPCDGGATCPSKNFKDVKAGDWYHLAVDFAVKEGLFKGMTETTFEPNTPMTRGMLVTVLWRYEGSPKEGKSDFTDLTADWYKEAVAWAASKGIVTGVGNGRFDPDGKITREQLAAILYRYSKNKGYDTSKQSDFAGFPDKGKISDWAKEAYGWAVGVGLITGNDGKLDPQGNATRAQVSTILMRFIEGIAK